MIIVQTQDGFVVSKYDLPSIPPAFQGQLGITFHNLEDNPVGVDIGWRYEGGDLLPPLDTSSSFGRIITVLAYRRRFTQPERIAIKMAAQGQIEGVTTAQAAAIASDLDDLLAAGYVHLDRADTVAGTYALEAAGLLGVGRAAEVISLPVYSTELRAESRVTLGLSPVTTDNEILANGGKGYTTVAQYFAENPEVS